MSYQDFTKSSMDKVKVIINNKEVLVFHGEASLLISKGLAHYPGQKPKEKAILPEENKAIQSAPQNKAGRPKKNATN